MKKLAVLVPIFAFLLSLPVRANGADLEWIKDPRPKNFCCFARWWELKKDGQFFAYVIERRYSLPRGDRSWKQWPYLVRERNQADALVKSLKAGKRRAEEDALKQP